MALPPAGVRRLADRLMPDVLDDAVADARELARRRLAAALAEEIVSVALAEDTLTEREPAEGKLAEDELTEDTPAQAATRTVGTRTRGTRSPAHPVEPAPVPERAWPAAREARRQPPAEPAGEAPAGAPPRRTGLYAYGITDAVTDTRDIVGLDDRTPVETLPVGEAALVASTIELGLLAGLEDEVSETGRLSESGRLADLAGRHDRVMRLLLARGPVLPLRFGTVLPDRTRAERLLRASAGELVGELDRVRDHREWGLRVTPRDDEDDDATGNDAASNADGGDARTAEAVAASGDSDETPTGGGGSGTAYLSARRADLRRAAEREERLTELTRRIHGELAALASDVAIRSGRPGPGRLDAAYLVASVKEDGFLDAADTAARELADAGCEARLTGPWPPYSFVRLTLGEARDA
ncbi:MULTISPECIES: GvpL/GvpF family gas vesicle protein [unclassified Pseudofrankia]|uniref:GvpL/GvpF family gas vesicle protein n=1 Tax=unclassified Pseudofrankia TaxID=2994372 RepID=UPI0008D992A7|nr:MULTISPECIES: GvpL/GvpF family gas vesicle protein [unclassified Pseudofrankia]MDT3446376.1 GvpL/GvpF family gas vesicle protein [Pseudofrankia sp. BMG5.37]OHV59308.1 gas vesicle protein GvpFL [Pseudofrankia sp. BMG5.36]